MNKWIEKFYKKAIREKKQKYFDVIESNADLRLIYMKGCVSGSCAGKEDIHRNCFLVCR